MLVTLTKDEVIRRLRAIRHSPRSERNARRAPSMNGIAVASGLTREFIHMIANGTRSPSSQSIEVLSRVLTCEQVERAKSGRFPTQTPPRRG